MSNSYPDGVQEDDNVLTTLLLILIAGLIITALFYRPTNKQEAVVISPEKDEWCLRLVLPTSGGSFSQSSAGEEQYQIIATSQGYEVYQKCEEDN